MNDAPVSGAYLDALTAVGRAFDKGAGAEQLFAAHTELLEREAGGEAYPIARVREAFSLSRAESMALDVAAARLFSFEQLPDQGELREMLHAFGAEPGEISAVFGGAGACLDPMVCDFLLGRLPRLPEGVSLEICGEMPRAFHGEELAREIGAFLDSSLKTDVFPASVLITGAEGSGKRDVLKRAAALRGNAVLMVETKQFDGSAVLMASLLYDALVLVKNAGAVKPEKLRELACSCGALLMTECDPSFSPEIGGACLVRGVPELTPEERLEAMKLWLGADDGREWAEAARFYRMTPGQLRAAAERCAAEDLLNGEVTAEERLAVLREVNSLSFAGSAELLETNKRLSDLVLPPVQQRQIEDICDFARARYKVFEDWGFAGKVPYGRGISALFYGASGTGKTLAASVIANELGLRLYRADISQLISKYVGETQKNIGRIFDSAQNSGCILFFDEADALFARRSDSGDSQDKYSNAEIAYLLQRTEQYDGIILMATNLLQNFDDAFRRRIGYIVYFPLPDETQRLRMWEGIFPDAAPKGDLDLGLLAASLELTGAGIRNTAVNAAYMAAAADEKITMAHIAEAARLEYGKQGKAFPQKLGMMFPSGRSGSI